MDLLNGLVGNNGCAADGTVSATSANPLNKLADKILHSQHYIPPHGMAVQSASHVNSQLNRSMLNGVSSVQAMMLTSPLQMRNPQEHLMMQRNWEMAMNNCWNDSNGPNNIQLEQIWQNDAKMKMEEMRRTDMKMKFAWEQSQNVLQMHRISMENAWKSSDNGNLGFESSEAELVWQGQNQSTLEQIWKSKEVSENNETIRQNLESAWDDAKYKENLDFNKIWDYYQDDVDKESLEAAWANTSSRLENLGKEAVGDASVDAYQFKNENSYLDKELYPNVFETGIQQFNEGNIQDAILCFESELQRNPDNSEAWKMLGQSYAENDQDRMAIGCLERSVDADPYNLEALLSLGVSYLNELDSSRALKNLKAWVKHNPKYSGIEFKVDEYADGSVMDEVMQLMHSAEQWDPRDADVKVVLGVLYNVSRDFDSAVVAFERAIDLRPEDYSLWNKLGATLANNNRSEEAIPSYVEALKRKPKYVRAWLNLGISYANRNVYNEAAACYLHALQLNSNAKHIWTYLRIVFTCMERFDLVQKAGMQNLDIFKEEFLSYVPSVGLNMQFEDFW